MNTGKSPKKSDVLEVRLPHATKAAFMARCREMRCTASEVVRGFIDQELRTQQPQTHGHGPVWRAAAAALAGLAIGAIAAPSLARPLSSSHVAFDRLDVNHDGVLGFEEFARR